MSGLNLLMVYASVPKIACKRKCTRSCGPIDGAPAEKRWFEDRTGQPFPDPLKVLGTPLSSCPYLDPFGACRVYDSRPLICRLWGVVPDMRCPWGCEPERWMTDAEVRTLYEQLAL